MTFDATTSHMTRLDEQVSPGQPHLALVLAKTERFNKVEPKVCEDALSAIGYAKLMSHCS